MAARYCQNPGLSFGSASSGFQFFLLVVLTLAAASPKAGAGALPTSQLGANNTQIVNVVEIKNANDPKSDDYYKAIQDAYAIAIATGRPLYFPAGTYTVKSGTIQFLLNDAQTTGVTIFGEGKHASIINVEQVASSPQFWVGCTSTRVGAEVGAPVGSNHSVNIQGIGIVTNTPGIGVRFGLPGLTNQITGTQTGYTDPMNEPELDLFVTNNSTSSTARAVEMNYVLNGLVNLEASVAGPGTALVLNQLSFTELTGIFTAPGGTGVAFREGFNAGNILKDLDIQKTSSAVVAANPKGTNNTFVGGKFQYSKYGVDSTAAQELLFLNPQALPTGAATAASFFGSEAGVTVAPYSLAIPPRLPLASPFLAATNAINVMAPPYNAKAKDGVDDSEAINRAFRDALTLGRPLYFPAGRYWTGGKQLVLSLGSQARSVVVFGDGIDKSVIDVRDVKISPQVFVRDTTYSSFKFVGMGIWGWTDSVVLQLGISDFSDSLQNATLDLKVFNFNEAPTGRVVQVNDVRNSTIRLVANKSGAGTAMEVRQAISNYFSGSYGSWKGNSIWIRNDGTVVGNSFVSVDLENVNVCLVNDAAQSWNNIFWGGRFSFNQNGIFSNAGQSLFVVSPNRGPNLGAGGLVGNGIGLQVFH